MALYRDALRTAASNKSIPGQWGRPHRRAALMTARLLPCRIRQVVAERGTELVGWYLEQQRERARPVARL
jgi:hypothetical protein